MSTIGERWAGVPVLIATVTGILYAPVVHHHFLTYDDPVYVVDNPPVRAGLTAASFWWAVTAMHASNWHPVTWWSHMLDVSLFGLDAGRHLLVSVGLHATNAVLLF